MPSKLPRFYGQFLPWITDPKFGAFSLGSKAFGTRNQDSVAMTSLQTEEICLQIKCAYATMGNKRLKNVHGSFRHAPLEVVRTGNDSKLNDSREIVVNIQIVKLGIRSGQVRYGGIRRSSASPRPPATVLPRPPSGHRPGRR